MTSPRFERMTSFLALLEATRGAARGCRGREGRRFLLDREAQVLALQAELREGRYQPAPYRTFTIQDPKPRTISAAAFRDRVVHHALCTELGDDLERGACDDSFASRPGKGTLAALRHAQRLAGRYRFALKLDVEHFFETMDHEVLLAMLRARVKDRELVGLAERFVRAGAPGSCAGKGVPIGNLTSQHFANFMLGSVDRLVTRGLRVRGYARYMDDMLLFADSKEALWSAYATVQAFVRDRLKLSLKGSVTAVRPVTEGVPFLGWRLFPAHLRLDHARRSRLTRKLRGARRLPEEAAARSMTSLVAWARWGPTLALRRSMLKGR